MADSQVGRPVIISGEGNIIAVVQSHLTSPLVSLTTSLSSGSLQDNTGPSEGQ